MGSSSGKRTVPVSRKKGWMDVWMDRQEKVGSSSGKRTVPVPLAQKRMDGLFLFRKRRDRWMSRPFCELIRSPSIGATNVTFMTLGFFFNVPAANGRGVCPRFIHVCRPRDTFTCDSKQSTATDGSHQTAVDESHQTVTTFPSQMVT